MTSAPHDAVVVGGGHNGLVAATMLARAGRSALVLERGASVGGAAVCEPMFPGVDARLSRYAYLDQSVPGRVLQELGVAVELRPRPHTRALSGCARLEQIVERVVAGACSGPSPSRCAAATQLRALIGDDDAWEALFERPLGGDARARVRKRRVAGRSRDRCG